MTAQVIGSGPNDDFRSLHNKDDAFLVYRLSIPFSFTFVRRDLLKPSRGNTFHQFIPSVLDAAALECPVPPPPRSISSTDDMCQQQQTG